MTKEKLNQILENIDKSISEDNILSVVYEIMCVYAQCFYWTFANAEDEIASKLLSEEGETISFISRSESDIFHTIELAKKYLYHICPDYVTLLEQYIVDGTIDMNYDLAGSFTCFFPKNRITLVDCAIDGKTSDVAILIHEFFHATNRMNSKGFFGPIRDDFSEMISIFYEIDCMWYLYEKGDIPIDAVKSTLYERISNTLAICRQIVMQADIVNLYRKIGPIELDNDRTYQFAKQFEETNFFTNENDYYEAINDFIDTLSEDEMQEEGLMNDYGIQFLKGYHYIVGTTYALSLWQAKQTGDKSISVEMLWLNKHLNDINRDEFNSHLKTLKGKTIEDVCTIAKEVCAPFTKNIEYVKK